ncbi:MAG TPA: sodium/proton-translocating pyrophosphatase, partial [Candidatus Limnocylindrales bacterium]
MSADTLQLIILPAGIIAVLFALYLARDILSRDTGTKEMQDVAGTIFEGAIAFIRRQYTTIAILAVVGAVVIGAVITIFETAQVADTKTFGIDLGWRTSLAFLVGAACSMASGIIG